MIASTGQFWAASAISSTLAASGSRTSALASSSSAKTSGSVSTQSPKPKHRARSTSTRMRFFGETCGAVTRWRRVGDRSLLSSAMRVRPLLIAALAASALAGCGKDDNTGNQPVLGIGGGEKQAAQGLGFPSFATKNTTRIGGGDAVADAAAIARAVYPAATPDTRPDAVTLVDRR